MSLLCRASSESTLIVLFYLIYEKVFSSPFSAEYKKNWVMSYFPHLELQALETEHPVNQRKAEVEEKP